MKNLNVFRKVNETEKKIIGSSLHAISSQLARFFDIHALHLYIKIIKSSQKFQYPKLFFLSNELIQFLKRFPKKKEISSCGTYIGFIKKGELKISLEGIEYFYINHPSFFSAHQFLIITAEGEKSFLYGNNIRLKMIQTRSSSSKRGDFMLVLNQAKELLGIAVMNKDYCPDLMNQLNKEETMAITLQDKGYYLREPQ
ncbi:MAG: hypothetical protein BAJALOKI1v1_380024 [Promethearchaeota archaeon]|nr:MAG: hypothetical protein BAJALOKI1v1_380024 [Candidatus Lokiarchaeota archaeon]